MVVHVRNRQTVRIMAHPDAIERRQDVASAPERAIPAGLGRVVPGLLGGGVCFTGLPAPAPGLVGNARPRLHFLHRFRRRVESLQRPEIHKKKGP